MKCIFQLILVNNVTFAEESEISEEMIQDCCREQMAGYKRPKKIVFIKEDEMPRTPTGKILHRKLRDKFSWRAKKIYRQTQGFALLLFNFSGNVSKSII